MIPVNIKPIKRTQKPIKPAGDKQSKFRNISLMIIYIEFITLYYLKLFENERIIEWGKD